MDINFYSSIKSGSEIPNIVVSDTSLTDTNVIQHCRIVGYVSKVGLGVGRSDNDRQFVFCNGRPVDLPKVIKVLNEVGLNFILLVNSYLFMYTCLFSGRIF